MPVSPTEHSNSQHPQVAIADADSPTISVQVRRIRPSQAATNTAGRYRPVTLHARGGVGEVYRAADTELDREVALKQLPIDVAFDPEGQARFVREARITGRLQHPGIVPVYGLVHDSFGRPCYAMRFVEGESLAEAIARCHAPSPSDSSPPSLRQLLLRFIAVCNTVAYAHSKSIVHRDLKPANVLLGPFGETYVVDWGLAKEAVIEQPPKSRTQRTESFPAQPSDDQAIPDATWQGLIVGTPSFMAPEQAEGRWEEVGPAADVYSLGATLYQILTGCVPFPGGATEGVLDRVRAGRFPRPHELKTSVPAALEAVCIKAMAFRPGDRYASSLALAADVERWLADEPIEVYRERWPTRLIRWSRRRRALVGAVATAGIVAIISLAAATMLLSAARQREQIARELAQLQERAAETQRDEATRQRDEVTRQRDRAADHFRLAREAVAGILSDTGLGALRDIPQAEPVRRKLLEKALTYHQAFLQRAGDDPSVREEAAFAYIQVGHLDAELGRHEDAIREYEKAIALLVQLDQETPATDKLRTALWQTFNNLSSEQNFLGLVAEAERSMDRALGFTLAAVIESPKNQLARAGLAKNFHNLGNIQASRQRWSQAESSYRRALKIGGDLLAEDPTNAHYRSDQAKHYHGLGMMLRLNGKPSEAEPALRSAIDMSSALSRNFPRDADYDSTLANSQMDLARLFIDAKRSAEAEALLRKALKTFVDLTRDYPYRLDLLTGLASVARELGDFLSAAGRKSEAIEVLRLSAQADERAALALPGSVWAALNAGGHICNFGMDLAEAGQHALAIEWYAKAIRFLEDAMKSNPKFPNLRLFLYNSYWNRAVSFKALGRHEDSLPDWTRAIELAGNDADRAKPIVQLGWACLKLGQTESAKKTADRILAIQSIEPSTKLNVAAMLALTGSTMAKDNAIPPEIRARNSAACLDQAMTLLNELRNQPILNQPANLKSLRTDRAFDALRNRSDFQNLLADLHTAGPPK